MMAVTGFVITSLSNIRQDLMGFRDEFKLQCCDRHYCGRAALPRVGRRFDFLKTAGRPVIACKVLARGGDAILFLYCCWCLNSIVTAVADYSVASVALPALFYLSIVMIGHGDGAVESV
jgi:hypothetical protein